MVRAALEVPVTTALLKGRANYVATITWSATWQRAGYPAATSSGTAAHRELRARYPHRNKSELAGVPEEAPAWSLATRPGKLLGAVHVRDFRDCFVRPLGAGARADLVVVNLICFSPM